MSTQEVSSHSCQKYERFNKFFAELDEDKETTQPDSLDAKFELARLISKYWTPLIVHTIQ